MFETYIEQCHEKDGISLSCFVLIPEYNWYSGSKCTGTTLEKIN